MQETFLKGRCFDKKGAITNESVDDLKLTVGEEAAVIKSSDVMIAVKD